ncbi:histidinol-phosphate transaminase [Algiphilus aromaticivorans]|uniref:histidinol-phosphate transaminase n=1 Tax=Algiphilus aromaticivorans TaxID=382454 RepID=UPI000694A9D3|nr:histidinol-phosphate transaminase [Algiphilus aromaticivorans]
MAEPEFLQRVPEGIRGMAPYQPGMPIDELQRRLGLSDVIKLASNENPLGCSPQAAAVLRGEHQLARYPDGGGFALKAKIAAFHGVAPEQVTLGNGSNDLLEFVARIFLGPGRAAMYSRHAFAVYPLAAAAQNAPSVVVPARPVDAEDAYGHDLVGFARALSDEVAAIFIANPNNPTGTCLPGGAVADFLGEVPESTIVVLDEAYWDYQDPSTRPDIDALLARHPNLLVTRTFSKIYGLAALRLGYGLSHPALADLLNRVRQPFNNNSLALAAGEAALADQAFVAESVALNARERARLERELSARGLQVLPSHANFVAVGFGRDAAPIHQGLLEAGIIVRPMGSYEMPHFLRVSVGTETENDRFLAALDGIMGTARDAAAG